MIKITAPICFDIVERMENNTNIRYIYEDYKPTAIVFTPEAMNYALKAVREDLQVLNSPMTIGLFGDQLRAAEYDRDTQAALLEREIAEMEAIANMNASEDDYRRFFCTDLPEIGEVTA